MAYLFKFTILNKIAEEKGSLGLLWYGTEEYDCLTAILPPNGATQRANLS